MTITVRVALPLYKNFATILLAYGLIFLPRALRLAAPGVAAAVSLVSLGIMNELTARQMLAPGAAALALTMPRFQAIKGGDPNYRLE